MKLIKQVYSLRFSTFHRLLGKAKLIDPPKRNYSCPCLASLRTMGEGETESETYARLYRAWCVDMCGGVGWGYCYDRNEKEN